ncbi:MAG: LysR family transcriptional regulator [Gammaproteobacteria bacterium]
MLDLKPYVVLAQVIESGSMSAAARKLGLSPSAISQTISNLERQFGVTLLHRSTRKLALTEAAERCHAHCVRLLEAADAATASLEQARDAPTGELRIAAPVGFGAHVAPALAPVLAEWPSLRLRLIVDDAMIDLVQARIDIALRVGPLADSNWIGRKLCELEPVLCAAPAYLERHGTPASLADLARHDWLAVQRDAVAQLPLEVAGETEPLNLPLRTSTTNQIALQQMCEQGMGMARLFHIDARGALERGALVRVLPQRRLPSQALTLLTPSREGEAAKVRVAVAALKRYFSAERTGP